jgi:hypothetical protein
MSHYGQFTHEASTICYIYTNSHKPEEMLFWRWEQE